MLGRGVRQWDPNPPPEEQLDLNNIHLKMANITKDSSKKGWEAYQVSLSNEVRGLHLQDPVNAPAWRSLITDFDKKPLVIEQHWVTRNTGDLSQRFHCHTFSDSSDVSIFRTCPSYVAYSSSRMCPCTQLRRTCASQSIGRFQTAQFQIYQCFGKHCPRNLTHLAKSI